MRSSSPTTDGSKEGSGSPLAGQRVLVTRPKEGSALATGLLLGRGAEPVELPLIALGPPPDPGRVAEAVRGLPDFDVVVFASANAVAFFFAEVTAQGSGAELFAGVRIAAIGRGTAQALQERGLHAQIVPSEFIGETLARAILEDPVVHALSRPRVLLLRAWKGRDILPEALRGGGCAVDLVPVYETRPASRDRRGELRARLEARTLDWVMLTSSSGVDALLDLLEPGASGLLQGVRIASIGPITSATARARGLTVDVTAAESTVEGLIVAMEARTVPNPGPS